MKTKLIPLLLIPALLLGGCSGGETDAEESPEVSGTILASGDCFTVEEERSDGVTKYTYTVTDRDGNVLESAACSAQPKVAVINDGLLGIRFYNDNGSFCRYYDIENGRVGGSYFNAFWDDGELVAYHDYSGGHRFIVRDIFDDDGYYYELEVDSLAVSLTVTECEQDEEDGSLAVKYVESEGGTEASITLPTRQIEEEN